MRKYRFWTNKDLALVRERYPREGAKALAEELGRSAGSIHEFARRNGIVSLAQVGTYTMDAIKARCVIDDDKEEGSGCWEWTGAMNGGVPYCWHNGSLGSARRVAHDLAMTRPLRDKEVVRMSCENPKCINPAHMTRQTRKRLLRENAQAESALKRAQRISLSRQNHRTAKLDMQKALQIRLSDEPSSVLAARYDVSQTHINRIRRGEAWADLVVRQLGMAA